MIPRPPQGGNVSDRFAGKLAVILMVTNLAVGVSNACAIDAQLILKIVCIELSSSSVSLTVQKRRNAAISWCGRVTGVQLFGLHLGFHWIQLLERHILDALKRIKLLRSLDQVLAIFDREADIDDGAEIRLGHATRNFSTMHEIVQLRVNFSEDRDEGRLQRRSHPFDISQASFVGSLWRSRHTISSHAGLINELHDQFERAWNG